MIVATAGHIDHGKTTLVKALTGVDTDRLPEEKARGISIDLGFAYCKTAGGDDDRLRRRARTRALRAQHARRRVRHRLRDAGRRRRRRRDAADGRASAHRRPAQRRARRRRHHQDRPRRAPSASPRWPPNVRALLAPTALAAIDVHAGVGGQRRRHRRSCATSLSRRRARTRRREHAGRNFRYAIDRAFTIAGSGTVVTGTVFNGAVAAGDKLDASRRPASKCACARIQKHTHLKFVFSQFGLRSKLDIVTVELSAECESERGC